MQAFFDAFYYANCCGRPYTRDEEWLAHFGRLADRLIADFMPQRVLDAGCATGLLVEGLRARGVDAWGVDISEHAIDQAAEAIKAFCRVGSIAVPFGSRYDLITCIEVVEHMPAAEADLAIANLCAHATEIVFSSSPEDYREPTHVNVHPPEHWAEAFARHGFVRDVDYDASYIAPWAMRLRRTSAPLHRVIRDYERRAWLHQKAEREARAYAADVQARLAHVQAEVAEVRQAMDREVSHLRELLGASEARRVEVEAALGDSATETARLSAEHGAMDKDIAYLRELLAAAETRRVEVEAAFVRSEAEVARLREVEDSLSGALTEARGRLTGFSRSIVTRPWQWARRLRGHR
jgi:SAM-dependent methyltransferase